MGIKRKRNTISSSIYPPPNPKEKSLKIAPKNAKKWLKKSPKRTNRKDISNP
jgi:hypothetical protein